MSSGFKGTKDQIEWRRNKVLELSAKGNSLTDIAKTLQVSVALCSYDMKWWREQAKKSVQSQLLDERIPIELTRVLSALDIIVRDTFIDIDKTSSVRDKTSARTLIKDIYLARLELLTSAPIIQRGLSFVTEYKQRYEQLQLNKTEETEEAEDEEEPIPAQDPQEGEYGEQTEEVAKAKESNE